VNRCIFFVIENLDFLKRPSLLISGSGGRPLPRARFFGFSRFRNRASKKKKSQLDLWTSL